MECTCSEDLREIAVAYCACQYPPVPLCKAHAEKHLAVGSGFHFTLPLTATESISSEEAFFEVKHWLFQLNNNYDVLRKKVQLISNGEEQMQAVYQDALHFLSEAYNKLKASFSIIKEGFLEEIEEAIGETRLHALERDSYVPVNSLAQLLWNQKPSQIAAYQVFSLQSECIQQYLASAFHLTFYFTIPDLAHLNRSEYSVAPVDYIEEQNNPSVEVLPVQLDEEKARPERPRSGHVESDLEEFRLRLQSAMSQIDALRADNLAKDERFAVLEQENAELHKLCRSQTEQLTESRLKLETALKELAQHQKQPSDDKSMFLVAVPQESVRSSLSKARLSSDNEDQLQFKPEPVLIDNGMYSGYWNRHNQRHGFGKMVWMNGDIYEGQWRNDQRCGEGTFVWPNGDVYAGSWTQNQREGFGVVSFANGAEYSGMWVRGKRHGIGLYKYRGSSHASGDCYIGEFSEGERNGRGAYFSNDGTISVGMYQSDKQHGKGLMGRPNGDVYYGEWKDGEITGTGTYVWRSGNVYRGGWKQNMKCGQGRFTKPGVYYEGGWVNNMKHGEGVSISKDGSSRRSRYMNGAKVKV